MKKLTILISFFLFFLLISVIPFSNTVKAGIAIIPLSSWDDIGSGVEDGTSGYFNFTHTGVTNHFLTTNSNYLSYPNSLEICSYYSSGVKSGRGYWNLTSTFPSIEVINFSFYATCTGVNNYVYMHFYNGSDEVIQFRFYLRDGGFDTLDWYALGTGWVTISTGNILNARKYLVLTHNGTNQFNIKLLNSTFSVLVNSDYAGSFSTYTTFTHIYLTSSSDSTVGYDCYMYFDNIQISTMTGGGGTSDVIIGYDVDSPGCSISGTTPVLGFTTWHSGWLNPFGLLDFIWPPSIGDSSSSSSTKCKYLEVTRESAVSRKIFYVDLYVGQQQKMQISSSLLSYSLYVNGIPVGNPIKWVDAGDGYLILRWSIPYGILLTDEKPLFEFSSDNSYNFGSSYGISYWYPAVMSSSCGYTAKKHNDISLFGNGNLNGYDMNMKIKDSSLWGMSYPNLISPYIKYYYTSNIPITNPTESSWTDSLIVTTNKNEVSISGTVGNVSSTIHIYNTITTTEVILQDFPFTVYNHDFNYNYHAIVNGSYNATIEYGGNILISKPFVILSSDIPSDYDIYCIPSISDRDEIVTINYLYNDSLARLGMLFIGDTPFYNGTLFLEEHSITSDTGWHSLNTGVFHLEKNYYITLCAYVTGHGWLSVFSSVHPVKSGTNYFISLTFAYNPMDLSRYDKQYIYYQHNQLGNPNLWLKIDGKYYQKIGISNTGIISYPVTTAKEYSVSIVIYDGTTEINLITSNFTAITSGGVTDGDNPILSFLNPYKLYIGIFIVVLFTLIPLIVGMVLATKTSISIMDIPGLVYVAFFLMGIVISCTLGFFELWVIFFVLFALILVFAITWIQSKTGE